ncbi:MAG: hypothetical protein ACYTJ0_13255 [Planctomycetota bacterium]
MKPVTDSLIGLGPWRPLREDLSSGRAGWAPRVGLSMAAAAAWAAGVLLAFGLVELTDRYVSDAIVAGAVAVAGVGWTVSLLWIWAGHRRVGRVVRSGLLVLGIVSVTIPTCVVIEEVTRAEFLTAGVAMLGLAAVILVAATTPYRARGGRPIEDLSGTVRVDCPGCGYSLVGLDSCHCPECGHRCTVDELIRAQDYAVLRDPAAVPAGPSDRSEPAGDGPVAAAPTPAAG